jgi:hypothetical protein
MVEAWSNWRGSSLYTERIVPWKVDWLQLLLQQIKALEAKRGILLAAQ